MFKGEFKLGPTFGALVVAAIMLGIASETEHDLIPISIAFIALGLALVRVPFEIVSYVGLGGLGIGVVLFVIAAIRALD